MKSKLELLALNADSIDISNAPKEIKVLPLGLVKSQKGEFVVDKESFYNINKQFSNRKIDIVVDYEHQTLSGDIAPAAGWIKKLTLKQDGIYAQVQWTSKAKEYLANKEYRYLSPVILIRKTDKKAMILQSVALTNTPAIDGMDAIVNSIKNFEVNQENNDNKGAENMGDLKEIALALGLDENATKEDIIKAIADITNQKTQIERMANKLQYDTARTESEKLVEIALSIGQINEHQREWAVERCMDDIEGFKVFVQGGYKKECASLVSKALSLGKITPFQKEWAERYALKDYDGFKTFVEESLPVVPYGEMLSLKGNSNNRPSQRSAISSMLNVSEEDIKKYSK